MEIEKYRTNIEIIRSTAQQVRKDLGFHGTDINISGNPASAYTELVDQITPILKKLYKENRSEFMNLMYRIDIDEAQMNMYLTSFEEKGTFTVIVDMILERELLKCISRKLFQDHEKLNQQNQ